jgi:hypothetical protein
MYMMYQCTLPWITLRLACLWLALNNDKGFCLFQYFCFVSLVLTISVILADLFWSFPSFHSFCLFLCFYFCQWFCFVVLDFSTSLLAVITIYLHSSTRNIFFISLHTWQIKWHVLKPGTTWNIQNNWGTTIGKVNNHKTQIPAFTFLIMFWGVLECSGVLRCNH